MNERCEELLLTKYNKYEKVAKAFSRFFDEGDLVLTLDRKADVGMVEELRATKANKMDNY